MDETHRASGSLSSHSSAFAIMSFIGWEPVCWKTPGEMTPGFLRAIVGLKSPRTVSKRHLAAATPVSSE
jgi:hypothetical protein